MVSLLLDTHILLWWRSEPAKLSVGQAEALLECERGNQPVAISAITLWELAKLVERGRRQIEIPLREWLEEIETHPRLRVLPLTARIIAESTQLGEGFHNDPADQLIVATARCHGLRLVTANERIRRCGKVAVV